MAKKQCQEDEETDVDTKDFKTRTFTSESEKAKYKQELQSKINEMTKELETLELEDTK